MGERRRRSGLAVAIWAAVSLCGSASAETRPQQRPAPPERPAIPAPTAADCEVPATRDALLANPERVVEAAAQYGMELNRYSEQLMAWRGGQLIGAGRWTEEQERAFAARLLENEAFVTEAAAGMNMAMDVLEPAMQAADESRPAAERCRSLIAMVDLFDGLTASVERQWLIVDQVYDAEARRLGLNLE